MKGILTVVMLGAALSVSACASHHMHEGCKDGKCAMHNSKDGKECHCPKCKEGQCDMHKDEAKPAAAPSTDGSSH